MTPQIRLMKMYGSPYTPRRSSDLIAGAMNSRKPRYSPAPFHWLKPLIVYCLLLIGRAPGRDKLSTNSDGNEEIVFHSFITTIARREKTAAGCHLSVAFSLLLSLVLRAQPDVWRAAPLSSTLVCFGGRRNLICVAQSKRINETLLLLGTVLNAIRLHRL